MLAGVCPADWYPHVSGPIGGWGVSAVATPSLHTPRPVSRSRPCCPCPGAGSRRENEAPAQSRRRLDGRRGALTGGGWTPPARRRRGERRRRWRRRRAGAHCRRPPPRAASTRPAPASPPQKREGARRPLQLTGQRARRQAMPGRGQPAMARLASPPRAPTGSAERPPERRRRLRAAKPAATFRQPCCGGGAG
eukprot:scaffold11103_cov90-Isochrysis_galbana.AAC.1